jgi:hypothetical protein
MAIFNNILYFATYLPPGGTASSCSGGGPNLYAWDFVNPNAGCGATHSCGGVVGEDPNFVTGELNTTALVTEYGATISSSTIIPGVSIASTPSCTTTAATASDAYTGGAHTATTPPAPGNYSLMANLGKGKHPSASANLLTKSIAAPPSPTIVDSWAAVSE